MRTYLLYLRQVLRHKWYVFWECCRLGIPFLGLVHDSSKFLPSEFFSYARWFYGKQFEVDAKRYLSNPQKRHVIWYNYSLGGPGTGPGVSLYVREREGDALHCSPLTSKWAFDVAWLHHQKRNRHHWQYWHLYQDEDPDRVLPMPDRYRKEMLADWHGAGIVYTGANNTLEWYTGRREKMKRVLHPETREWIEAQLNYAHTKEDSENARS